MGARVEVEEVRKACGAGGSGGDGLDAEALAGVSFTDATGAGAQPVTRDAERGVRFYTWAHDGRHLLYLQDVGGDENWRLFRVDPETRTATDLTPFAGVQAQIVAHERHRPHELVVALNRDDPSLHDVYHLDLRTSELALLARNPGDVASWVADADLGVRAAVATTDDGGSLLRVRDTTDGRWREIVRWAPEDALVSSAVAFTRDGRALYLLDSRDANATRLVRLDLASGAITVLAEDPRYDVSDLELHPDTREVQLVGFTRARQEWTVLDAAIADGVRTLRTLA